MMNVLLECIDILLIVLTLYKIMSVELVEPYNKPDIVDDAVYVYQ